MTPDPRISSKAFFRAFAFLSMLWITLLVVFNRYPWLDIDTSTLFYTKMACEAATARMACGHFWLGDLSAIQSMRLALYDLPYIAAAIVLVAIFACYISPICRSRISLTRLWLSLASLGVSTGLLVNLILKGHSGRPRPVHADLFGGLLPFMPAGSFEGACKSNCSFVSGEASGAGWLICLLLLLPVASRGWLGPPLVFASIMTVFLRVAVGAHFLSDVLLGWLLSVAVFCGVMALEPRIRIHLASARQER